MKRLRRWLRRLGRHPRLVSHQDWCHLRNDFPGRAAKITIQRRELRRLNAAHTRERAHHRRAVAEKRELAYLLAFVAPPLWQAWKQRKIEERRRLESAYFDEIFGVHEPDLPPVADLAAELQPTETEIGQAPADIETFMERLRTNPSPFYADVVPGNGRWPQSDEGDAPGTAPWRARRATS